MKQVEGLTAEEVLKVARKYLTAKNFSLIIMTPAEKAPIEKTVKAWLKNLYKRTKLKPTVKASKKTTVKSRKWIFKKPANIRAGVEKWNLDNGITLITRPNFETPVINLRCASLGGSRLEDASSQGATELLSRVWTAGAGDLSEFDMNVRIDEMAASLSAFGGRNSEGLGMSCLRPFADDMLKIFFDTLLRPHFEETAITREKKSMIEHVKLRQDNPAQICILEFMKTMFGDHPYGRDIYGDEKSIERLNQAAVKKMYESRKGLTIVASGAFDPKELRDQVKASLVGVNPGSGASKLFDISYPKENLKVYRTSAKQQSHLIVGYPGLNLKDPERFTLQVMQAILAGQGGRLFIELRDKASLAYSVSPMRMEGLEGGYFGAYIGCSPEKSATALRMMLDEFTKLVEVKVPAEELARAQRYLIGKHDIELQKNSSITSSILFDHIYGIDFLDTYKFTDHIRAVTAEGIRDLAKRIFSRPSVTALVGPTGAW
jgi:zinc protease